MLLLLPKIHNGLEHEEESRTGTNSLKMGGIQQLGMLHSKKKSCLLGYEIINKKELLQLKSSIRNNNLIQ